jgi:alkylation response protein AidB-like acyl-CoA dehydrogenase
MDFAYSEAQAQLKDSVERFLAERYDVRRRKALFEDARAAEALWREMAELGWIGAAFLEADGGYAESALDAFVVMEGFGRRLMALPYLTSVILCGDLLRRAANADELVAAMVAGRLHAALAACGEALLHSPQYGALGATRDGSGYRLSGRMSVVLGADRADKLLIAARTGGANGEREGVTLFLVDAARVSRRAFRMIDGQGAAELAVDALAVGAEAVVGEPDGAVPLIEAAVDRATVMACAEACGSMAHLIPATAEHIRTRQQYGAPLAKFQVLQHRMADAFIAAETARSMAYVAAIGLDGGGDAAATSLAKHQTGRSGRYVAYQAVQLHGGLGVSEEMDISHHYIRLTMIDRLFGDQAFHLRRYADLTRLGDAA